LSNYLQNVKSYFIIDLVYIKRLSLASYQTILRLTQEGR
jgi:hypothetical protein